MSLTPYWSLTKKSSNFIKLLNGFTDGINAYAAKYPDEILESSLFPLTPKKLLRYTQLQLFISNGAADIVGGIVENELSWPYDIHQDTKGSNLLAISRSRTQSCIIFKHDKVASILPLCFIR